MKILIFSMLWVNWSHLTLVSLDPPMVEELIEKKHRNDLTSLPSHILWQSILAKDSHTTALGTRLKHLEIGQATTEVALSFGEYEKAMIEHPYGWWLSQNANGMPRPVRQKPSSYASNANKAARWTSYTSISHEATSLELIDYAPIRYEATAATLGN
ncbi:hypothetical protein PG995_010976 [Apiospora arundinis]